jgi:Ca2+-binding EF-hand superfamily protein
MEQNPDFCVHLTPGKVAELHQAFQAFAPSGSIEVEQLGGVVRSLGGDYKWMKVCCCVVSARLARP